MLAWLTTLMKKTPGTPWAFQFADIFMYLVSNGLPKLESCGMIIVSKQSPSLWGQGEKSCQVSGATRSGNGIVAWGGRLVKGGFLVTTAPTSKLASAPSAHP
jgi:hypothetical protein